MNVSDMVRAMREAGCSPEQIVAAVENWDGERRTKAREGNVKRQRAWRQRHNANNTLHDPNESNALTSVSRRYSRARVEDSSTTTELAGKNNRPSAKKNARDVLLECLKPETADAVLEHRKAKRCPLTPFAAQLLVKGFQSTADPEDAAQTMIARGWQGFKAEWYDKDKKNGRGKRSISDVAARLHPAP